MGTTIGWLCGTNEDGGTTKAVMGGQTVGGMGALHRGRAVVEISNALPPTNTIDPAMSIILTLGCIVENYYVSPKPP